MKHLLVTGIIILKVAFIILALWFLYAEHKLKDKKLAATLEYWKDRVEFMFTISMSFLLIYIFQPRHNRLGEMDYETRVLFYLFGYILLITADWRDFVHESKWFGLLQKVVGNKHND